MKYDTKISQEGIAVSRTPRVAGIILAAGKSSGMASSKLLLPFRGKTVLENVIDSALRSPLYKIVVVLGHQAHVLRILLTGKAVALVHNPRYESGQYSSIQAGLLAVRDDVDAVLVLPGNQPLITPEIIDSLLKAYSRNPSPIVIPVFNGKRGNPALFDRQVFQRIQSLSGDSGARPLYTDFNDQILEVPVLDPAIHSQIGSQQDYLALLKEEQSAKPKMAHTPEELKRVFGS